MASISGTGLTFPDNSVLSGIIGTNYIARWAVSSQTSGSGSNDIYCNLEVAMPAPRSNNSRYLLMTEVHCDDTNSDTAGVGLSFWVANNTSSYWVDQQGHHSEYFSGGADHYFTQQNVHIDDGTTADSPNILTNSGRTYRVYGDANNSNIWFCTTHVGGRIGWTGYLLVVELDGGLFS